MNISEIQNNQYKIKGIKMKNDEIIKDVEPPLNNNYNFFYICIGKPGSGKTNFWMSLLNKRKKNTYFKKFDKVYIFSKSIKTISDKIKLDENQILNDIDDLDNILNELEQHDFKTLIIFDDMISDIKANSTIQKLIFNRRHISGGVSLIIATQVYNKLPLCLRKAATDLILWKTSNKKEIKSIYEEYILIDEKYFHQILEYTFNKPHSFLWIKAETDTFYKNFNKLILTNK